jgi:hypothetical protein
LDDKDLVNKDELQVLQNVVGYLKMVLLAEIVVVELLVPHLLQPPPDVETRLLPAMHQQVQDLTLDQKILALNLYGETT